MESTTTQTTPDQRQSGLQRLVDRYRDFPDFRCGNANQNHLLLAVLVSAICAVLGGANSWLAVERFVSCHLTWSRSSLHLPNGVPSHDTYRRIFLVLDPGRFDCRFADRMKDLSEHLRLEHMAIDGKTSCGSGGGNTGLTALHLVHAFATQNGICLAQQAVDGKSNEIAAIPELLRLLDLKGALVTIDAMGCQKEIAAQIVEGGADYVLAVKGNQEHLHEDVKAALAPVMAGSSEPGSASCARTEEFNRGRAEVRTCHVITDLGGIRDKVKWKGLKAIGVIVSERIVDGVLGVGTRYFISSRVSSAHELSKAVRDHWKVEDQLHWVLDVVFGEDAHQLRVGNGPKNFSTLRELAQALIKHSNPKHGIKGTREMAGWDTAFLEQIIHQAAVFPSK